MCSIYSLLTSVSSTSPVCLPYTATIHQVTIMLATSKNVLFPGHNHLLTTGTDDQTFDYCPSASNNQNVGSSVRVVSRCL